jgi:UDP-N-acetylglucosamine transferase subunit ALG13
VTGQAAEIASPRIVVTVGTDHHPFDRLIDWTNDWLGKHPERVLECFVQSGPASVVPSCPASAMLAVGPLNALLDAARVIVCHGGPASIADAWARGQLPIVVPRLPELGEHVDDHQVDFCRKVAELGRIRLAQAPGEFAGLLDEAISDPAPFRVSPAETDVAAATARLGELVGELVGRPHVRLPLIRRSRTRGAPATTGSGVPAGSCAMPPALFPAASPNGHAPSTTAHSLAGIAHEEQE